jgi:hypothetical protein
MWRKGNVDENVHICGTQSNLLDPRCHLDKVFDVVLVSHKHSGAVDIGVRMAVTPPMTNNSLPTGSTVIVAV